MIGMIFQPRLTSSPAPRAGAFEGLIARLLGFMVWAMLGMLAVVMALSMLLWVLAMTAVSLIASVFTGRPAAVTLLWRRWRELAQRPWPQRRPTAPVARSAGPDAASVEAQAVQDVRWRDLPPR